MGTDSRFVQRSRVLTLDMYRILSYHREFFWFVRTSSGKGRDGGANNTTIAIFLLFFFWKSPIQPTAVPGRMNPNKINCIQRKQGIVLMSSLLRVAESFRCGGVGEWEKELLSERDFRLILPVF